MFEKNSSWVITGTYLVLRYPRKRVKQKIKTYQLIHFYTLNPYLDNVLFLDPSRRLLFSEGKQENIGSMWVGMLSDVINSFKTNALLTINSFQKFSWDKQ